MSEKKVNGQKKISRPSPEMAAQIIQDSQREQMEAALNEINAVCQKHGVQLVARVQIVGNQVGSDVQIVPATPARMQ